MKDVKRTAKTEPSKLYGTLRIDRDSLLLLQQLKEKTGVPHIRLVKDALASHYASVLQRQAS
jgi:hypothetical protein